MRARMSLGCSVAAFMTSSTRTSASCGPKARNDLVAVLGDDALLLGVHQIDVELGDARLFEGLKALHVLLGRAQDGKALDDVVGDELQVLRVFLRVLTVVVPLAALDVGGEARGHERGILSLFFYYFLY